MVVLTMIEMAGRSGKVISLTKGDLHRENSYLHVYRSGMADTGENNRRELTAGKPAGIMGKPAGIITKWA